MKQIIISTLALFILTVSACEENTAPDPSVPLPKLERVDKLNQETGTIVSFNYTYENDLLSTVSDGIAEYRYHYANGEISDIELWKDGSVFVRYLHERLSENKVSVSTIAFDTGVAVVVSMIEETEVTDTEFKSEFYSFSGGVKTLDYYVIKSLSDGNLITEESFNLDGTSRDLLSSWRYSQAINPMSYVLGSNRGRNRNLSEYHSFSDDGTIIVENTSAIEVNELGLPVTVQIVSVNTLAGEKRYTESYFYE